MRQALVAADRLLNTLLGGRTYETLSARAYRDEWMIEVVINWLFRDPKHCMTAHQKCPPRPCQSDERCTDFVQMP